MDVLLDEFPAHINAVHPAIRFTREEEEDGMLAVLDAQIYLKERGLVVDLFCLPQADPCGSVSPVLQQPTATAQAGGHKDVGPLVCHHLQGQGVQDPGDSAFEDSAKCLRIHQEGLEGGKWSPPRGTIFRPSTIHVDPQRQCCHPIHAICMIHVICGPGF